MLRGLFHTLAEADPRWLWLAGLGFLIALVGSAGGWRSAVALLGGRTTLLDATARYGAGSLTNTFVPAHAGDAVRVGLFSRLIPPEHRVRRTTAAFAAVGAARCTVLAALVAVGAAVGAVPLWPLAVLGGVATLALVAARLARRRLPDRRDVPRLLGWLALSTAARFVAAAASCAAVGIHAPFAAAIIVLPALELAGIFPVTPGNIGVTSGAVALALGAHGVSFDAGIAAGIAFHAGEIAVGLLVGTLSVLYLAPGRSPLVRRVALAASAAGVAAAFSATVLVPLV
ncbi:MAG TPA: lysylphosphatidylglycerol synthase domain-containing protein [Gaiellaceae bacterium]|nr:lysylphosphatidylglycerol synthase domain-containing protein [Gaiellaceae bacterium]